MIIPKNVKILPLLTIKQKKAGVHRSKCTPAEILSLPTVSAFLLVLLLLCLLFLAQTFTDGACLRILMEQICHLPLIPKYKTGRFGGQPERSVFPVWVLTGFACCSARKSRLSHAVFRKCSYTCCACSSSHNRIDSNVCSCYNWNERLKKALECS